jgi:precorrin-6B methylase 2
MSSLDAAVSDLPQPRNGINFEYIRSEKLSGRFFDGPLKADALVWILKSKGRRKTRQEKHPPSKCIESSRNVKPEDYNDDDDDAQNTSLQRIDSNSAAASQRLELFLRARICCEQGVPDTVIPLPASHHVRVRYPKGSTYNVASNHIVRVLDQQYARLVLVMPETPQYRRACVVHTLPDEVFLEIGCDTGSTTERVYRNSSQKVLGVDKSEVSLARAKKMYPHLSFIRWDILENADDLPMELHNVDVNVVAIDVNGNRELEAVLQCLQIALDKWKPRLVIVKSRTLHQRLHDQDQGTKRDAVP